MALIKSSIRQVRDQLFIDTADGKYLTAVSNNAGLDRPTFWMSDDSKWRAIARRLALDAKSIAQVFRDLLSVVFGPQITSVTVLSSDVSIGDDEITISDPTNIPQRGTLVIDDGLTSEESIEYSFRDPGTGVVKLRTSATGAHTADVTNALSYLTQSVTATATSITVVNSYEFPEPTGGDTVSIVIGAGTTNEEVVAMSNNNKTTGELTISALVNNHDGPKPGPVTSSLVSVSSSRDIITVTDTVNFTTTGYIRITELGGTPTEDVVYTSKNNTTDQLVLGSKLVNTYTSATIDLLQNGESVQLSQIKVAGVSWDIFQTEQNVLKMYIPVDIVENRLLDASFLHGNNSSGSSTFVESATSVGDKYLSVVDASGFDKAGVLLIDSGGANEEYIGYARIDRASATLTVSASPGSNVVLYVNNVRAIYDAFTNGRITDLLINDGGGNEETVTIASVDTITNRIVVSSSANSHSVGESLNIGDPNKIYLLRPLELSHSVWETVQQYVVNHTADLENGKIFTITPARYQGSYTYEHGERLVESTKTVLDENLAGPLDLLMSQLGERTALEVRDASLFNTADFQRVQVGRNLGNSEIVDVSAVYLRRDVNALGLALIGGGPTIPAGTTTFSVSGSGLPQAFGYRLFIDDNVIGGNSEEVAVVKSVSGSNVVLESGFQYTHENGDNVKILADVIKVDTLGYDHEGFIPYEDIFKYTPEEGSDWALPTRNVVGRSSRVALVEEVRSYIKVVNSASFSPTGGYAIINSTNSVLPNESRLNSDFASGVSTISVLDGTGFPSSSFFVRIGVGTRIMEVISVSSRVGSSLILANSLMFNHKSGETVQYIAGDREVIYYTGKETNRITSSSGFRLASSHAEGEAVVQSSQEAIPGYYGSDYPFYLSSFWGDRLEFVFDLARAAGIKIEIIQSK